jgi:hypothetical protein
MNHEANQLSMAMERWPDMVGSEHDPGPGIGVASIVAPAGTTTRELQKRESLHPGNPWRLSRGVNPW